MPHFAVLLIRHWPGPRGWLSNHLRSRGALPTLTSLSAAHRQGKGSSQCLAEPACSLRERTHHIGTPGQGTARLSSLLQWRDALEERVVSYAYVVLSYVS